MKKSNPKKYFRLTKAERASIERALDKRDSARAMARDLGRSPSTITDEIKRNRAVCKGPGKGERVTDPPTGGVICPKLEAWPWVCNGCKYRRYHCSRTWRCEYSAARAQALADTELKDARTGVNHTEEAFEDIMASIRFDVARGLSPAQIASEQSTKLNVAPSTVYRWISKGYGGMCNAELRRQVGYKPRKENTEIKSTAHGYARSYAAFTALPQEDQARACEMDTVIGRARDTQCILTLYLRPCKVQLMLLLPEKSSSAVAAALDMLESTIGKPLFQRLFGLVLTDNGTEFSDSERLERSVDKGKARMKVYYCDVRQSQQKARCERNHVELRKLLPKDRGISFDKLVAQDMAVCMSHLNSEPRHSLFGATPLSALRGMLPNKTDGLLDALGITEVYYDKLILTIEAINKARRERGEDDLI